MTAGYDDLANVPAQVAGSSPVLASDWNTYVRANFDSLKFGHVVVTTYSSLPSAAEGTMAYVADTNKFFVYSGSAWVEVIDLDNTGALADTNPGHRIVADNTAKTALGNVAEGFMVYQLDNNKLYVNSNGTTANWVEISDLDNASGASASVQSSVDGIGLVKVASGSLNAQSTDITGIFSSSYKNYKVLFDITNDTLSVGTRFRFLSGTTTPETGSVYSWVGQGLSSAGTSNSTYAYLGDYLDSFLPHPKIGHISMDIINPNVATNTKGTISAGSYGSGEYIGRAGNFLATTGTQYTGLRIYSSNGSLVLTGSYWVFGYNY